MSSIEELYSNSIKKPSLFWLATEGQRALIEFGTSVPYRFFKQVNSRGDGHPVLVLPGFMASDFSTSPLRSYLDKIGYKTHKWGMGRNYGDEIYLDLLIEKIEDIFLSCRNKVSIIGWSLGGVFAREIAKNRPEIVRQVVTLGSPFGGLTEPNNAQWMYNIITGGRGTEDIDFDLLSNLSAPAPVPTTAIYTKEDGVVSWKVCMETRETDIHQNIQVRGSHIGLGVNPFVLEIITNRLQYRAENWVHYK